MADDVTLPGTGVVVATDDDGTRQYQWTKPAWGPDNTFNKVDTASGKPLPIQLRSPTGVDLTGGTAALLANPSFGSAAISSAAISVAASGDNTIVTRSVGTIKVYGILIVSTLGVTMTFKNGAGTSLTGAMDIGTLFLPIQNQPYFTTTGTNNFILNLGSAVQCSGVVYYLDT